VWLFFCQGLGVEGEGWLRFFLGLNLKPAN
jgi:hypothetical protein